MYFIINSCKRERLFTGSETTEFTYRLLRSRTATSSRVWIFYKIRFQRDLKYRKLVCLYMAYYLVRADPHTDRLPELHDRLSNDEFESLRPFGPALTVALRGARFDADTGDAVWEEEDYCRPPLAQERTAVLDDYFDAIRVEQVTQGEGWKQVETLPSLWAQHTLGTRHSGESHA